MLIPCPHCGNRDLSEYSYLGDASVKRPKSAKTQSDKWCDFVYNRHNPRGPHREHWQHSGGCRQIFEITRDTSSHEILRVKVVGAQKTGTKS